LTSFHKADQVEWVRPEPTAVTTLWWRGVGPTHNVFVVEGFIDELAAAAGKDPLDYRGGILGKNPRALAVLNLAAEKAGWGISLPSGTGPGIALQFAFNTYMATVLEAEVTHEGGVQLRRANVAVIAVRW
jgi:isoquinoline 1-oxidoreductase subunit beta